MKSKSKNKNIDLIDEETAQVITVAELQDATAYRPYNTPRNYKNRVTDGVRYEKNDGISLTVPNEALSIREIMSRYAAGLPITGMKVPMYHGDTTEGLDLDNWKKMDLSERDAYIKRVRESRAAMESTLKKEAQDKIDARKNAEFQAAIENELKKRAVNAPKDTSGVA